MVRLTLCEGIMSQTEVSVSLKGNDISSLFLAHSGCTSSQ